MQNSFGSNTNTHKTVINTNSRWNRKTHLRARFSLSLSLFQTHSSPSTPDRLLSHARALSLYITRARAPLFFSLSLSRRKMVDGRQRTLLLFVCKSRASSSLVTRGLYLGFHKEVFLSLSLSLFLPLFFFCLCVLVFILFSC